MLASIRQNFALQGRPAWSPAKRPRNKILVRTGALLKSNQMTASGNKAAAGTNLYYGIFHHFGTRRMPMRRFVMFQPEDITAIALIFRTHIAAGFS
jgi:phage gpG-like protein